MRRVLPLLCAVLACGAFAAQAAETIYQWKDANGVTHYSSTPPPKGAKYQRREVAGDRAKPPAAEPAPASAPAGSAAAPAAGDSARCEQARRNLEYLRSGAVVGLDANGDGQPDAPLDEAARARQAELAQAAIKAYCRGG
ncbi:DUF4124 domain-containing protein [Vulcaniibacterium gelatinicum]|uniref:DUF4124 domain-containing protein n=1 Tax=Vulcaniibacterium gelatinicum TaxID=2598725 RepID=UPI0011C950D7|nr:DUF4124 domain-containing protein [Vulcaniibacterium gelatinicum]